MPARQESCSFTGHRPEKLPWGYNEKDERCVALKARIADAVGSAYEEGYRHFICGMAMGCDFYFCDAVLALQDQGKKVTLEAAIPCPTQADRWPKEQRKRYQELLARCSVQTLISPVYNPGCMLRRDRYLVDHAALLIAAFDGSAGGTRYTLQYALSRGVPAVDVALLER